MVAHPDNFTQGSNQVYNNTNVKKGPLMCRYYKVNASFYWPHSSDMPS